MPLQQKEYLVISLPKESKDMNSETVRYWQKISRTTQTGGEIYYVLGLEESILWKWLFYPKQSMDSLQPLSNCQWLFFTELEEIIPQFTWKHKRSWIAKATLRMKLEESTFLISDNTTKLQSSDSMVPAQKIKIDQWKKIERPEINLRIYGHIIFDKGSKNMQ